MGATQFQCTREKPKIKHGNYIPIGIKAVAAFWCGLQGKKTFYGERMPPTGDDGEKHYQLRATLPSHL